MRELFAVRGAGGARHRSPIGWRSCSPLGTFVLVYRLLRSRHGLALAAIRDSETAAESAGVDVFRTKLLIYVVDRLRRPAWPAR